MPDTPPRRWYQFKLSTILVLVGILAWTIALRPSVLYETDSQVLPEPWYGGELAVAWGDVPSPVPIQEPDMSLRLWGNVSAGAPATEHYFRLDVMPRQVVWPIFTLIAIAAWKFLSNIFAIRHRRRRIANSTAISDARVFSEPFRTRFRFRLTTILFLVAVVAWAMSMRPTLDGRVSNSDAGPINLRSVRCHVDWYGGFSEAFAESDDQYYWAFDALLGSQTRYYRLDVTVAPLRIIWPLLALAAFLTWKIGWAVAKRRKRLACTRS